MMNSLFLDTNLSLFQIWTSFVIIISSLLTEFRLVVEHGKTIIFHFSRSHGVLNPPPLDLTSLRGGILLSKLTWLYLGFYFDQKLLFCPYIDFYINKTISTIKYMKMLSSLSRGLAPIQKRYLYICCLLSLVLYRFQLWYYNKAPLDCLLYALRKMQ